MNFWTFLDRNGFGVALVVTGIAMIFALTLTDKSTSQNGCHVQIGTSVSVASDAGPDSKGTDGGKR